MDKQELEDLIEIALRNASAVERRWIVALVQRINAAQPDAQLTERPAPPPPEA